MLFAIIGGLARLTFTAVVLSGMWLAGRSPFPRARQRRSVSGATYLRGGLKVAAKSRLRLHWYAWPGWQRTVVRVVITATTIGLYLNPVLTAVIEIGIIGAFVSVAVVHRQRVRRALAPRKIRIVEKRDEQPAISAGRTNKASALFGWFKEKARKVHA